MGLIDAHVSMMGTKYGELSTKLWSPRKTGLMKDEAGQD
jgi:hypothetical protein